MCALVAVACSSQEHTPVLMFDKSHGQCLGSSYTADVVPDYEKMAADNGAEFVINEQPFSEATLAGVDVVLMLSPLQHDLQKNITDEEEKVTTLIHIIKSLLRICGFELIRRIEIRSVRSGRSYR